MLKGLRTIFNFAMDEGFAKGEKSGMIKGSVGTIAGIGIVYVGYCDCATYLTKPR